MSYLDDRRARWVLCRLGLWPATDDHDPAHDAAAALASWERLRTHGYRVTVTTTPPHPKDRQLDPEYHVRIEGGAYRLSAFGPGPTLPVALWRAARVLARHAFSARVGPLDRALRQAGDPPLG